ncbi:MAG: UDP-N-acetylmuramoyl-tripeptide--D-alanyl-D-alanine ligase [Rhodobacteraceae bacterium]|nr:UDP-N-acetylmuramoyl-tripeptide--D-alanyl-D-alanine ligase [Paracoccaceae bacterium]
MMLWNSTEADGATGGKSTKPWCASGVSIDSRTLSEGDLFVALHDRRDGHDFLAAAFSAGAAAAMVSRIPENTPRNAPLLVVEDVECSLSKLGAAGRSRSKAKVIAVTGSVGKTSTKEMLRHVLQPQGKTAAGELSFNNHWGVPITLAQIPSDAQYAVVEIGMNNPGEILPLAKLTSPDSAIITKIAPAHLAAFDSLEDIAREKSSIFAGVRQDGTAIINAGSPSFDIMNWEASARGLRIVSFGRSRSANWRLQDARVSSAGTVVKLETNGQARCVKLASAGQHFAENALGVLAAVESLGADPVLAALDLATWQPPPGRGNRHRVLLSRSEDQELTVIDDAFNASPVSLAAALEMLASSNPGTTLSGRPGTKVAILGDMLELGARENEIHTEIADLKAVADIDVFHCAGQLMHNLHEALPADKRGMWFATSEDMASQAHALAGPGDVVLVKGSKGSRVSVVVDAIRKLGSRRQR